MIPYRKISGKDSFEIRYGSLLKIPQLKKLWKECFADEDAYISDFFDAMYANEQVLVAEENGVLMGASFFLPGNIWLEQPGTGGKWQPVRYVYALAVWPQFRGRGVAAGLLRRAYELYHAPLIAEPADEGLIGGFYEPLGFTSDFYLKKDILTIPQYDIKAAQTEEWKWTSAKAEQYCSIRDARFQKHGYVSWPQQHVAFAISQHSNSGGGAYVLHTSGREEVILYFIENQDVIVTETTLSVNEWMQVLVPRITAQYNRLMVSCAVADSTNRRIVSTAAADSVNRLVGMSYGLPPMNGYLNLSLD